MYFVIMHQFTYTAGMFTSIACNCKNHNNYIKLNWLMTPQEPIASNQRKINIVATFKFVWCCTLHVITVLGDPQTQCVVDDRKLVYREKH